jgi:hypothetical protein
MKNYICSKNTKKEKVSDQQIDAVLPARTNREKLENSTKFYRYAVIVSLMIVGTIFGYFSYNLLDASARKQGIRSMNRFRKTSQYQV